MYLYVVRRGPGKFIPWPLGRNRTPRFRTSSTACKILHTSCFLAPSIFYTPHSTFDNHGRHRHPPRHPLPPRQCALFTLYITDSLLHHDIILLQLVISNLLTEGCLSPVARRPQIHKYKVSLRCPFTASLLFDTLVGCCVMVSFIVTVVALQSSSRERKDTFPLQW